MGCSLTVVKSVKPQVAIWVETGGAVYLRLGPQQWLVDTSQGLEPIGRHFTGLLESQYTTFIGARASETETL